ncbi:hypothetical protein [Flexibacterium corallicola]|uniref:hypothetical protein n=1 Tax=Flexibacterium corallicola TaxID=3037259 RepID=UPI00286ED374|nr:hypothetical protein [Pseudovibrio sp. M1P-2-3]
MVVSLLRNLTFMVVLFTGPQLAGAQTHGLIRLATQQLPPYQMVVNGQLQGVAIERVKCALKATRRPFEIHMSDWTQAQLGTETAEYEGFFVGSANSTRARYAIPSKPVISEDLAWYMSRHANINPNDPADALKARYSAKFATSKWLNLKRRGFNVVKKPQDAQSLLNMLLVGDIDVALEYELIFEHFMEERNIPLDRFTKIRNRRQDLSVHFSKKFLAANPLFLEEFNAALPVCIGESQ